MEGKVGFELNVGNGVALQMISLSLLLGYRLNLVFIFMYFFLVIICTLINTTMCLKFNYRI